METIQFIVGIVLGLFIITMLIAIVLISADSYWYYKNFGEKRGAKETKIKKRR